MNCPQTLHFMYRRIIFFLFCCWPMQHLPLNGDGGGGDGNIQWQSKCVCNAYLCTHLRLHACTRHQALAWKMYVYKLISVAAAKFKTIKRVYIAFWMILTLHYLQYVCILLKKKTNNIETLNIKWLILIFVDYFSHDCDFFTFVCFIDQQIF